MKEYKYAPQYERLTDEDINRGKQPWTTMDGLKLTIAQMNSKHIANCIDHLWQTHPVTPHLYIEYFEDELDFREEAVLAAIEEAILDNDA